MLIEINKIKKLLLKINKILKDQNIYTNHYYFSLDGLFYFILEYYNWLSMIFDVVTIYCA